MRLAKCCFLLLTFRIWLPAGAKCQEERDKGKVKGLVIFLTVHSSLLAAACGLNAALWCMETCNVGRLSAKACLLVLQQLISWSLRCTLAVSLTLTFPPQRERVLASGRLLTGLPARRWLGSLRGEFSREADHALDKSETGRSDGPANFSVSSMFGPTEHIRMEQSSPS